MVLRGKFLTIFLSLLFGAAVCAAADRPSCLKCHVSHYEEAGDCVGCHRGNPRTDRLTIAHYRLIAARFSHFTLKGSPVVERGLQVLKGYGCRRCHVSGGEGNRLASNLDRVSQSLLAEELFEAIKNSVMFMPNFSFQDEQIVELVNAIFTGGSRAEPPAGEVPLVVHFEEEGQSQENAFVKHCGGCHKVLTARFGGLGQGEVGPNLAGLFSQFYPRDFREGERWLPKSLEQWLKNPRQIRANATMPPVPLRSEELAQLIDIFQDAGEIKPHVAGQEGE